MEAKENIEFRFLTAVSFIIGVFILIFILTLVGVLSQATEARSAFAFIAVRDRDCVRIEKK